MFSKIYIFKLIIILFIIFLNSCITYKFSYKNKLVNDFSVGLSNYNYTTYKSPDIGPSVSFSTYNFYLDMSNNLVFGKGTEYSMMTYDNKILQKVNVGCTNIGYNIKLSDTRILAPTIGYAWCIKIYSDNNYPNSYYRMISGTNINLGLNFKLYLNNKIGLMLGIGTYERIKLNFVIKY